VRKETLDFFSELMRFPSTPGNEQQAMEWLARRLRPLCDEVALVPFPEAFAEDPEFSDPIPGMRYEGRANLRAVLGGAGPAEGAPAAGDRAPGPRSLVINAHVDVVPPSEGQVAAFEPAVRDGALHGRGACDDKGQIAALYEALLTLREDGIRPAGRLVLHLVAEEENGGNGTLALVREAQRSGERAEGVLVMEPTGLAVATASRSSVWFRVRTRGQSGHVGSSAQRRSALAGAVAAMRAIERRHAALRDRSRGVAPFEGMENHLPLTFGVLHAGTWPASVPAEAVLEGVFAFLPNTDRGQVMAAIRECLAAEEDLVDAEVSFPFRHECHVTPPDAMIVQEALRAAEAAGIAPRLSVFPASNDAWLYATLLGIPVILFGAGRLEDAHASGERIALAEVDRASRMLRALIAAFCGVVRP